MLPTPFLKAIKAMTTVFEAISEVLQLAIWGHPVSEIVARTIIAVAPKECDVPVPPC